MNSLTQTTRSGSVTDDSKWEWGPTTQLLDADKPSGADFVVEPTRRFHARFLLRTMVGIILVTVGTIMGLESSRVLIWLREVLLIQTTVVIIGAFMISFGVTVLLMSKRGLSAE